MRSFQEHRYWRRVFSSPLIMAILLAIIVYLLFKVGTLFLVLSKEQRILNNLNEEVSELQERKEAANVKINGVISGELLEKEARSNFNIKRPGEQTVIILEGEEGEEEVEGVTLFERMKDWFNN